MFGHLVTRVGESVGQLAIVGQQHQTGRVGIESADGIEPFVHVLGQVDVVQHGDPAQLVTGGGDGPTGLVQRNVQLVRACEAASTTRSADRLTIHLHAVTHRIDPGWQRCHRHSVDRHPTVGDELFRVTAGGNPRVGKHFLQSLPPGSVGIGVRFTGWSGAAGHGCPLPEKNDEE